jgi:hypothetical protein
MRNRLPVILLAGVCLYAPLWSDTASSIPVEQPVKIVESEASLKKRVLELRELLARLARGGDNAEVVRRKQLVAELLSDSSLSPQTRFRLAASSANSDIFGDRSLSRPIRMRAFAEVAWQLAKDFPENFESYESLLRIARQSDDAHARGIALKLVEAPVPEDIKERAQILLSRLEFVGKSLPPLLVPDVEIDPKTTKHICLFTWSAKVPQSLSQAKALRELMPAHSTIIAVCLDEDSEDVRATAQTEAVGAIMYFSASGSKGLLCSRLLFDEAGQVYVTDKNAHIVSVLGWNKLMADRQEKKGAAK